MAEVITMPRLSDTMTEGRVAKWHKSIGDNVNEGDILAEIETDKAIQDFESEFNGKILYIGVKEGEHALVDSILCVIGQGEEDISSLINGNVAGTEVENTTITAQSIDTISNEISEIPSGVEIVTMPRLSDTMTEGKVAKWHKNVGDSINEGDILAEIETDKAIQDFESEFNGVLLHQGVLEGEAALVDNILAIIGPSGTDVSNIISNKIVNHETEQINNHSEVIFNEEKKSSITTKERISISPLAKKIASEKGIDIAKISGSGDGGRIIKRDIDSHKPNTTSTEIANSAVQLITNEDSETPNSQVRNIIAKRLSDSKFSAPHYYLIVEVNMDKAIVARKEINSIPNTKVSFNDMLVKAAAIALRKHPQVNSSWAGDKIIHHGNINIGVAVAIPDGLVVPVLKNTDQMSYSQISYSVKDMASRAKSKSLKANEMEGSTFSISNLGMFGIESFTSIINQPNSAILSVGAIVQKPIVKDGQIVIGNTMKLSLACDHRVIDGATGAEFLQTLRSYLENPLSLLV